MGLEFYELIKDIQSFYTKKGKRFSNSIQTNGTLITNELLDFIEETGDFHIGMSLDGPKDIHNKTRVYKDGKGSFKDVMGAVDLIKKRKKCVGGGVICVITEQNINNPKKLYEFFKSENINVKFNPLIKSGRAEENLEELGITPKQYGNFLLKLWEIYNEDVQKEKKVTIDIDPFMNVIGNLETKKAIGCNYSVSCMDSFISISPNGDIYPCGRFDNIQEFYMGNIQKHTIKEVLNSEIHKSLRKRGLETVTGCGNCNFGKICNAGCMHNAYCNGDVFGKDPYCSSYITLFKNMENVLNIEKIKAERGLKNEEKN